MTIEHSAILRRVAEKMASLSIETTDLERYGVASWSGRLPQPERTGKAMLEFAAEQFNKVGIPFGDPKDFWDSDPRGELFHVFEAYRQACMIYEAERELESDQEQAS